MFVQNVDEIIYASCCSEDIKEKVLKCLSTHCVRVRQTNRLLCKHASACDAMPIENMIHLCARLCAGCARVLDHVCMHANFVHADE